jgi:preprotein translocase subunit YajC
MEPQGLLLIVLAGAFLFLMFNRGRRQQREARELQAKLTVGARIMTTAGLFATVVALDATEVTLETAPGQHSRWDRRAIARVIADEAPADDGVQAGADGDAEQGLAPRTTQDDATGTDAPSQDAAPPDRA